MRSGLRTEIDYHVAWRIMTLREEKAISRQEMSANTGIPTERIYRMETCNATLGALELKLFADILEVTPQYFFDGLKPTHFPSAIKQDMPKPNVLANAAEFARFFLRIDNYGIRNRFSAVVRNAALKF